MRKQKKCPAVGTNTGEINTRIISAKTTTSNIRYPAGAKPKNIYEARLLHFLQAETSLTAERRKGFWVDCHSDTLRLIGGGNYAKHMRSLEETEHIEANGRIYSAGRFPRSYRLTKQFRIPKTAVWPTAKRFNLKARIRILDEDVVGKRLVERFSLLDLPSMKVNGWPAYSVQAISERQYYAVRCPYDRFHSTFTSTAKIVRKQLKTNGAGMVECDIANCQPLLLGILAKKHAKSHHTKGNPPTTQPPQLSICCINQDLKRYLEICSRGYLYEYLTGLATTAGLKLFDFIPPNKLHRYARNRALKRKDLKRSFVVALFADNELMRRLHIWSIVETEFPTVASFILWSKRDDYRQLAHQCQRLESKIMVRPGGVADELLETTNAGLFTIHDAIAVPENLASLTMEIIKDKFRPYGVTPEVTQ